MSIDTVNEPRPHGPARDVLDYIAYFQLIEYVHDRSDSTLAALVGMPMFLRGNTAARRGKLVFDS